MRSGVAFPCKISSITIPLKPDADSVQWPILLPEDFVFWHCWRNCFPIIEVVVLAGLIMLCLFFLYCHGQPGLSKASTLIKEGYLSAITKDLREHPRYWDGMLKDFPDHPVKRRDPSLRASLGCTYSLWPLDG